MIDIASIYIFCCSICSLIEIFFEVIVMYCLERQTQTYFIYPSWLELAVKRFYTYIYVAI